MCTLPIKVIHEFSLNSEQYFCFCGEKFDVRARLTEHQKKRVSEECQERTCNSCKKPFKSYGLYAKHKCVTKKQINKMESRSNPPLPKEFLDVTANFSAEDRQKLIDSLVRFNLV